ncbi:hypothetical protein B296_00042165 [Ensete ventricosum]|uniref:Carboxypeptidase n=1 Tax=Ensete ventricosum TaxID=4639 RepID=A0A426XGE3_ENSVE|nr:hypothetical protein B296_00042165 [Ensete ventricosum]
MRDISKERKKWCVEFPDVFLPTKPTSNTLLLWFNHGDATGSLTALSLSSVTFFGFLGYVSLAILSCLSSSSAMGMSQPVSVPLLFLPLLLCSSSLSFGFVSAAGTADGSEEWGYVQVRPSKSLRFFLSGVLPPISFKFLTVLAACLLLNERTQKRTCSGGFTGARRESTPARRHGRRCCGCRADLFVEDESLFVKTDWEAATDLTTLLKKLYDEDESRQTSPLFIVAESYGGKFAVTAGLSILKAIEAGELKLKLGELIPSADAPHSQDFYNFLLDSASDPISVAAAQVPRRLSMKIYPTYLSSKASSISTDISSLMNGAIKDKLKIIPETVRYVIWSDPILGVEARFHCCCLVFAAGEGRLILSLKLLQMTS